MTRSLEETRTDVDEAARLSSVERACARLKVLPLAGIVLFPGTPAPLQPSEPRQRALITDALAGDRVLAVATPLSDEDAEDAPLHPIAAVGVIEHDQPLPDGSHPVLFRAVARVRLVAELGDGARYRQFTAELLRDLVEPGDAVALAARRSALEATLFQLSTVLPAGSKARWLAVNAARIASPGALADVVAAAVLSHPLRRRAVLDELDVARRLDLVTGEIASFVHMLSQGPSPSA